MTVAQEFTASQTSAADAVTTAGQLPPLRLPLPTAAFARCDRRESGCQKRAGEAASAPPQDESALAWYRWLAGHHLAVGVWRLQLDHLAVLLEPHCSPSAAVAAMRSIAVLYDSYSALLLYSGSCAPEAYSAVIRSRMKARHAAFSGTWAREYERISLLLAELGRGTDDRLKNAMRFNRLVHMSVGRRLVPNGKSLLRESGGVPGTTTDADRDRFDEFFLISREAVCRHVLAAVLVDRVTLVLDDIARVPLDIEYDNDAVRRFQTDVPSHLATLVGAVGTWKVL
ncbi:L-tyrosine 3-hydroxylase [Lentzea sp. DG1S-22]|uniref:L-tyrosine 3-hydroxylase n=1 Tax=Lentzea sp. DG1S-22 TaxID=3108822 RepID=UPI002E798DD3|nr:L-tyrosine 3-hydroxylase [Lentzea sp. DG1S-22]WVH82370.1 L-tyrosine 3-hydroxylase [Lentzea sp. DG1S-22]